VSDLLALGILVAAFAALAALAWLCEAVRS
jgi:hypothetical protein